MSGPSLDVAWIHGAARGKPVADPPIQIHEYDPDTYLLRQSKSINYEAPFLYLMFGAERALLLDTGATEDPAVFPLRTTVDRLIEEWLSRNPRAGYELIVAHTHAHGDHVAGDPQFADRPATTTVGTTLELVESFFGFTAWPEQVVTYDLGDRVLEITGSPGHQVAAITIFDPRTGFLLTGDTVYPGRLYVFDHAAFVASLDRLVAYAQSRPVTHVMGCHIEMTTTPGRDYPLGSKYQPAEPPLQMTVSQLVEIRDAAATLDGRGGIHPYNDFIIVNGAGLRNTLRLNAKALLGRIRS
jgi:hydroxyacylglutathione hydrolase